MPDLPALGADLFVCSPYKFFGPHCGVLAADPALLETIHPDKLLPSTDAVPERFELGTLPYEVLAGATAAVDFLADLPGARTRSALGASGWSAAHAAIAAHERRAAAAWSRGCRARGDRVVAALAGRRPDADPVPDVPRPAQRGRRRGPARARRARAGRVVLRARAVPGARARRRRGGVRVGLAAYTDADEVDRLLTALGDWLDA